MRNFCYRLSASFGVIVALWLAWLMLAWSVPAVAQYTPPPGCGTPCKVTVLQIKSGTTLTIKDASGNAGPVFTDAGTVIDTDFDGYASAPAVRADNIRARTAASNIVFQDAEANIAGYLVDDGTTGHFASTGLQAYTATGLLFEDDAGNDWFQMEDGAVPTQDWRAATNIVEVEDDEIFRFTNSTITIPAGDDITMTGAGSQLSTTNLAVGGGVALTGIMPFSGTFAFGATALDECLENTITATGVINGRPCAMSNFGESGQEAGLGVTCETNTDSISVIVCCREVAGCSSVGSDTYYVVTFKW